MQTLHPDACDMDPSHGRILAANQCSWEGAELLGPWWVLAPEEKPGCSSCLRCDAGRAVLEEGWQFPISNENVHHFLEQGWEELTQEPGQGTWGQWVCATPCSGTVLTHLISEFNPCRAVAGLSSGIAHSKT